MLKDRLEKQRTRTTTQWGMEMYQQERPWKIGIIRAESRLMKSKQRRHSNIADKRGTCRGFAVAGMQVMKHSKCEDGA